MKASFFLSPCVSAGNFSALYDIGFAYPGTTHTPSFTDLLLGRPLTIFLYVRYTYIMLSKCVVAYVLHVRISM